MGGRIPPEYAHLGQKRMMLLLSMEWELGKRAAEDCGTWGGGWCMLGDAAVSTHRHVVGTWWTMVVIRDKGARGMRGSMNGCAVS